MIYVPPNIEYEGNRPSIFLAGGISACYVWQHQMVELLAPSELVVLNPRRSVFPSKDIAVCREQIGWEYRHLRRATARLFWFPSETLCPIALFELGAATKSNDPLFVGMEPSYARRFDIEVQIALSRPDVRIVFQLEALAEQVLNWEKSL